MKKVILLLIALTAKINCNSNNHLEIVQINKITNQPEIVDELTQKIRDEVLSNLNKKVTKKTHPVLYEMISDLAKKMDLKTPETIYIFKADGFYDINGLSMSFSKSFLLLGQKLIVGFTYKEVRSLVAHELAHIKNRDTIKIASMIISLGIIRKLFYASIYKKMPTPFLKDISSYGFELSLSLAGLKIKRFMEKNADLEGIKFSGIKNLISYLEKDKKTSSKWNEIGTLKRLSKIIPYPFCYLAKKAIPLFSTHPSHKERIKYLKEEAERQEAEFRALEAA